MSGAACVKFPSGHNDGSRIEMLCGNALILEGKRHNKARKVLSVACNGIGHLRSECSEYTQGFDQFPEFSKIVPKNIFKFAAGR